MPTILLVMLIARTAIDITHREWVLAILMALSLPICLLINVDTTPVTFLNFTGVAAFFVWWGAGYFFCKYQSQIHRALRLENGWVCLGLLAALIVSAVAWPQAQLPKAVLGILLVISLSFNYTKRGFRFLNHLYGYSFTIYLLHWFVLIALRKGAGSLTPWVLTPIAAVCGVYIPVLAARFVQRFMPRAGFLKLLVGVR